MPISLHTDKIKDEKNAFVKELYKMVINEEQLLEGMYNNEAIQIHKLYLTLYIMNHYKSKRFNSMYYDYLLTSGIESESLILCGFTNASIMQLRSTVEMAFKMLYFEFHPIEWQLHSENQFDLRGIEYREFLYTHPRFSNLKYINREYVESVWKDLCKYTHFDISVINKISVIEDMTNIFSSENEKKAFRDKLKSSLRIVILILFLVDESWLKGVEKSYFDYIFELLYNSSESSDLKINLRIE